MNILHIHQDYPDGRPYPFTRAVSNLIGACEEHNEQVKHTVISINRSSNPFSVSAKSFEQGISIVYWAIPLPFLYFLSMKISAWYICKKCKGFNVDLIHGHKLTTEGLLAYFLAKKINKPFVLSVRGGSDMHNIKRLPRYKWLFQKVFNKAEKVFWVSAWAKQPIQNALEITTEKLSEGCLLPNICNIDLNFPQISTDSRSGFVTAVSYHQYKRKGLVELIEAISFLHNKNPEITLDIYGSGDDIYKNELLDLIQRFSAQQCVFLKGKVSQDVLIQAMSQSKGFLLPAVNETFGMAYIEALSVGCPILYVENTGIDGYFNDVAIGDKLKNLSVSSLTKSILKIDTDNAVLCENLKAEQKQQFLSCYNSSQVAINYTNNLNINT